MNNKKLRNSSCRWRNHFPSPLSLELSVSQQPRSSLFYSSTHSRLIELNKIAPMPPSPSPFLANEPHKHCGRKDCVDRKFQGIRKLNRSVPSVKSVSPRRVDIVLGETQRERRKQSIHSSHGFPRRPSAEKDLLKQFKLLEEMRRQLRSRNFQSSSRADLHIGNRTSDENPERSQLYNQVKQRISRRYNNMFRKFSQGLREEVRAQGEFLKDICSARSLRRKGD